MQVAMAITIKNVSDVDTLGDADFKKHVKLKPAQLPMLTIVPSPNALPSVPLERQMVGFQPSPLTSPSQDLHSSIHSSTTSSTLYSCSSATSSNNASSEEYLLGSEVVPAAASKQVEVLQLFDFVTNSGFPVSPDFYDRCLIGIADTLELSEFLNAFRVIGSIFEKLQVLETAPSSEAFEKTVLFLCRQTRWIAQHKQVLESRCYGGSVCVEQLAKIRSFYDANKSMNLLASFLKRFWNSYERNLSSEFYHEVLSAISQYGSSDDLLMVYDHMQRCSIPETAQTFISLIRGFGRAKDLTVAIECFNEYKRSFNTLPAHSSYDVYAALVTACFDCDDSDRAVKFFARLEQEDEGDVPPSLIYIFGQRFAELGEFDKAMSWLERLQQMKSTSSLVPKLGSTILNNAAQKRVSTVVDKLLEMIPLKAFRKEYVALMNYFLYLAATKQFTAFINDSNDYLRSLSMWTNCTFKEAYLGLIQNGRLNDALDVLEHHVSTPVVDSHFDVDNPTLQKAILEDFWSCLSLNSEKMDSSLRILLMLQNQPHYFVLNYAAELAVCFLASQDPSAPCDSELWSYLFEYLCFTICKVPQNSEHLESLRNTFSFVVKHNIPLTIRDHALVHKVFNTYSTQLKGIKSFDELLAPYRMPSVDIAMMRNAFPSRSALRSHIPKIEIESSGEIIPVLEGIVDRATAVRFYNRVAKAHYNGKLFLPTVYILLSQTLIKFNLFGAVEKMRMYSLTLQKEMMPHFKRHAELFQAAILDTQLASFAMQKKNKQAFRLKNTIARLGYYPSASSYAHIISNIVDSKEHDDAAEALRFFKEAKEHNVRPSVFLYNTVLSKLGRARRTSECITLFEEMKSLGLVPSSVTYGTVINAACRIGDETLAEELFEEMEQQPNYQARVAPYNTIIQFEIQVLHNRDKALKYYERLRKHKIKPSTHTYKLLLDAYGTLEPVDFVAVQGVMRSMEHNKCALQAMHYSAYMRICGCIMKKMNEARKTYKAALSMHQQGNLTLDGYLFQTYIDVLVANGHIDEISEVIKDMEKHEIRLNAYIVNSLITGFFKAKQIETARYFYNCLDGEGIYGKEPSTYETMAKAYLGCGDRKNALRVLEELSKRKFPEAVVKRVADSIMFRNHS
ncbi:PPR repeat protein [Schizosaccharomyces japonicus yFS275]|uniref:PPR repeat protein n=1 Tax=Schizosaccharomyces japonicus (strain yFS275 / FY16936) TaxID=402676 RepID=B6JWS0_SCHJY|nr:PPR repeat protein [Schizosaccharomyces japonicus yFS275]EEB05821.1 PPR repeat protein [Schizosaccharomyces japonicus yFS275]